MGVLYRIEKKVVDDSTGVFIHWGHVGALTFAEFRRRGIGHRSAALSFYAIFSAFPLVAFLVYFVGQMLGNAPPDRSAGIVIRLVRDFVPAMPAWIERGLFDVAKAHAVTSGVNGVLLAWSAIGFFTNLLGSMEALREDHARTGVSKIAEALLGALTLALFSLLIATAVLGEITNQGGQIPPWMADLPPTLRYALHYGGRSGALFGVVSIFVVAMTYKILIPKRVSLRGALLGSCFFTGVVLVSRSLYWLYLHFNREEFLSSYGVFSTLILIMLWIHFTTNCLLFGGLFAINLDRVEAQKRASRKAVPPAMRSHP